MILVQLKLTVECIGWLATTWSPPLSTTSHYRAKLGQWKNSRNFLETFKKLSSTSHQVAATVALNSASEKKRNFQKKLSKSLHNQPARKELSRLTRPMLTFLFQRLSIKFLPILVAEETILLFVLITFAVAGALQHSTFTKLPKTFWSKTDHLFLGKLFMRLINYRSFCRYVRWW